MSIPLPDAQISLIEYRNSLDKGDTHANVFRDVMADIEFFKGQVNLIRVLGRTKNWEYPHTFERSTNRYSLPLNPNRRDLFDKFYTSVGEVEKTVYYGFLGTNGPERMLRKHYKVMVKSYLMLVGELIKYEAKRPRT